MARAMNDFISDEEMERLASPAPAHDAPQGDFLTDEQMAQIAPEKPQGSGPVLSDDQMNRMANPDHAAVNALIRDAISKGATKGQVVELARQNGVVDPENLAPLLDAPLQWRRSHGDYTGYVDLFGEKPEIRTQPKNEVSTIDAIGQGIGQGLMLGFSDEIGAGLGAVGNSIKGVFGAGTGEDMGDYYTRVRDESRDLLHDAEDQHSWAYNGGQIAGAISTAMIGPATGAGLIGRAALEGGLIGAGQSEADTIGGVVQDAAYGAAASGVGAGALNRVSAMVAPKVAPLVDRLMGAGIELTPTQILKAGGPVARTIGNGIELVGRRGVVTSEVMKRAEQRGNVSLNRALADEAVGRDVSRRAAARALEGQPSDILPTAAAEAGALNSAAQRQAQTIAHAQANGVRARASDPTLAGRAADQMRAVEFMSGVPGADVGLATAGDLSSAVSRRTTHGLLHPGQYTGDLPAGMTSLIRETSPLMTGTPKGSGAVDKVLNILAGYQSGGATIAADLGLASLYTKTGQRVANGLLTGRQGPVPKAIRGIAERLSPLAGRAAALNTPYTEQ
jgi:hypothetical protein